MTDVFPFFRHLFVNERQGVENTARERRITQVRLTAVVVTVMRVLAVASIVVGVNQLTPVNARTARMGALADGRLQHLGDVNSVAFSPDGELLLTGGDDNARLWSVATGKELRVLRFEQSRGKSDADPSLIVFSVAFSPDSKMAVTAHGHTVRLWSVTTGQQLDAFREHRSRVVSVAFSPDGKLVLSGGGDATARLWDTVMERELHTLKGHTREVMSVAFSPDGKLALTGSEDKTARLWEVATGKNLHTFSGHKDLVTSVAFLPGGNLVLTASADKATPFRLWDVATGKEVRTVKGPTGLIWSMALSPDGKLLLTGGGDGTVRLWDIATGKELRRFGNLRNGVASVAFSPNGKQVVTASGKTVWLWDVARDDHLRTF